MNCRWPSASAYPLCLARRSGSKDAREGNHNACCAKSRCVVTPSRVFVAPAQLLALVPAALSRVSTG